MSYTSQEIDSIVKDVDNSGCFGRSKRQLELFKYLVHRSNEGKSSDVTQYSVALDVLKRPETFDANIDSIVRVEMHRLRANLDVYNAGSYDYLITIPPAVFQVIVTPRSQSLLSRWTNKKTSVAVTSFAAMATFFIGFAIPGFDLSSDTNLTVNSCSRTVPNLKVNNIGEPSDIQRYVEKVMHATISQQTSFNLIRNGETCTNSASAPLFDLNYTLVEQGEKYNIALSVISNHTGGIISSHHISGDASETKDETDFYYKIVRISNAISMPDSLTARVAIREPWKVESNKDAYSCIINMYDSFSGGTDQDVQAVHGCLKTSVKTKNPHPDYYGALAASYLDTALTYQESTSNEPFQTARIILDENESEWIDSAELTIAKLYFETQRPDFNAERLNLLLSNAEARYDTNPQVLFTVSSFYGYTMGKWEKAKIVSNRARLVYSTLDQSTFEIDAGYAFVNLHDERLMEECSKLYSENSLYINVIINACSRKAKNRLWYELTEKNLSRLNASNVEQRLAPFNVVKHDFQFINAINDVLKVDPFP